MIRVGAVLTLVLVTTSSHAPPRPSTVDRSCGTNQQLLFSRGAIVLGTGEFSYDRFVRDRRFCEFNEYTEPAFVPSLDTPQCFGGYRCKAGPKELFWD